MISSLHSIFVRGYTPFIGELAEKISPIIETMKNNSNQLWLLGGAVRDTALTRKDGIIVEPKDFDFVYEGDEDRFNNAVEQFKSGVNHFGGMKLSGEDIDVWNIENTVGLDKKGINPLLDNVFSALDSLAYRVQDGKIFYTTKFKNSMLQDQVYIINPVNPKPINSVIKCIVNATVLGFELHDSAKLICRDIINGFNDEEFDKFSVKLLQYSKKKELAADELYTVIQSIMIDG